MRDYRYEENYPYTARLRGDEWKMDKETGDEKDHEEINAAIYHMVASTGEYETTDVYEAFNAFSLGMDARTHMMSKVSAVDAFSHCMDVSPHMMSKGSADDAKKACEAALDGAGRKAGAMAHHKALGSIDAKGVTTLADYETVNEDIGRMVASAGESKTRDVYNAFAGSNLGKDIGPYMMSRACSSAEDLRTRESYEFAQCFEIFPHGSPREESNGKHIVVASIRRPEQTSILLDSGAVCHVCPKEWCAELGDASWRTPPQLYTADGSSLTYYGHRRVRLGLESANHTVEVTFVACNVQKPIFSIVALQAEGLDVTFAQQKCVITQKGGFAATGRLQRGLFYIGATALPLSRGSAEQASQQGTEAGCLFQLVAPVPGEGPQPLQAEEPQQDEPGLAREGAPKPLQEEADARALRQPGRPGDEQVEQHELTHLPAAPWCRACVAGRGREDAHRYSAHEKLDSLQPVIQFDYYYLTDEREKHQQTCVVGVCTSTGALWTTQVVTKGAELSAYTVASAASWLRELGRLKLTLQTDGEPALVKFAESLSSRLASEEDDPGVTRAACQVSPKGSHQSNGAAERALQTLRGLARVYLRVIAERRGKPIELDDAWWSWALRHAAWVYNRFHKKAAL